MQMTRYECYAMLRIFSLHFIGKNSYSMQMTNVACVHVLIGPSETTVKLVCM